MTSAGPPQELVREIETLTKRQREVLALLARGRTNPQIGEQLGISLDGAKWHVGEILLKLRVETREDAADLWRRYNGIPCRLRRVSRRLAGASVIRWLAGGIGAGAVAGIAVAAGVMVNRASTSGDSSQISTTTPTGTTAISTSESHIATYPPGSRTGITDIDRVLEAIESRDPAQIISVTGTISIGCVAEPIGIPAPPKCPANTQEGTAIAVVPGGCPETGYQALADYEADPRMPGVRKALFAVARLSGPAFGDEPIPPGDYQIFYADPVTEVGESVVISRGAVVNRLFACNQRASELWRNVAPSNVVLPPPGTLAVQPSAGPGVRPVDGRPTQFVSYQGIFVMNYWDDRTLSEREKAADPWPNPAWVPLSDCLANSGLEVRPDSSQPFGQADMQRLVARLNVEYPDRDSNTKLLFDPDGDAGVYLACANQWLTKSPQQIYEITGVPNRWWPPDTTVTGTPTAE